MIVRPVPERRFLSLFASAPDARAGLARAAVLLARTECPDADPDRVEGLMHSLAVHLRTSAAGEPTAAGRAAALADLLAGQRRLRGNTDDYEDPRNSCLECVLDRRLGIPLALSLVWMGVGRRVGWHVEGVGLPGHFVVRITGRDGESILADPFHEGRLLSREGLRRLMESLHGRPVEIDPSALRSVHPREVLLRMLRNLRSCYRRRGDTVRALAVAEDMLLLAPGLPEALRDRGFLRMEWGDRRGGLEDLRAFVERLAGGGHAEAAIRLLRTLTDDAEMRN